MTATRIPDLSIVAIDNVFSGGSSAFSCGIRLGTNLQAQLDDKPSVSSVGVAGGLATLDMTGKIPASQLSVTVVEYKGSWNATTNIPALADGAGNQGDMYVVSVGGTHNFGSGPIVFAAGDWAIYSGTVWERISGYAPVYSVNSQVGAVVLVTDDIAESITPTNLWYTDTRARASISSSATGITYTAASGVLSLTAGYEVPKSAMIEKIAKATILFSDLVSGVYFPAGDIIPTGAFITDVFAEVTAGFTDSLTTDLGSIEVEVNGGAADAWSSAVLFGGPFEAPAVIRPTNAACPGNAWGLMYKTLAPQQIAMKWTANAAETLATGAVNFYVKYQLA